MASLSRFFRDDEAATAVEYAVLLALILVAMMGAIGVFGMESGGLWGGIREDMEAAGLGK
jgi:pilus assembly protein Flp/PilA